MKNFMSIRNVCLLALSASLLACNEHPVQPLDSVVTSVNRQENRLPAKTKIDFLFVIDNSGSMCEEQANLANNFATFTDFLFDELGESADYRIAVTSTDMVSDGHKGAFRNEAARPVASLNCTDFVTGMPYVPDTAGCDALNLPVVLQSGPGGGIETKEDLREKFKCMATMGTQGDGFEKGLEAMRTALSCNGPNKAYFAPCCVDPAEGSNDPISRYNPACDPGALGLPEPVFLRPDALLVVIIVSDEDDCSEPMSNRLLSRRAICKRDIVDAEGNLFDADGDMIPDGFRDPDLCQGQTPAECYAFECGTLSPQDCRQQRCEIPRTENNACEWYRSNLTPVPDYARFLTSLKASPVEQLVVATIVGQRDYTPAGFEITYNTPDAQVMLPAACAERPQNDPDSYTTDQCCPDGRCRGDVGISCISNNGVAFAGRRYLLLTEDSTVNGIGCPPVSDGPDLPAQRAACEMRAVDEECGFSPSDGGDIVEGKCRPIPGEANLACAPCVTICEDQFDGPLNAIKEKVGDIIATYCLDKVPACQVPTEEGAAPCTTPEQFTDPANYAIRVRMQCRTTIDQGGQCQDLLPPTVLPRTAWSLRFNADGCPNTDYLIQLNDPPPAGAEVFLEFLVEVATSEPEAAAEGAGGAPDAPEMPMEEMMPGGMQ